MPVFDPSVGAPQFNVPSSASQNIYPTIPQFTYQSAPFSNPPTMGQGYVHVLEGVSSFNAPQVPSATFPMAYPMLTYGLDHGPQMFNPNWCWAPPTEGTSEDSSHISNQSPSVRLLYYT